MNPSLVQSEQKQVSQDLKHLGHIGVLMGGYSSEREISLKSGQAVFTALQDAGCQVTAIDITSDDEQTIVDLIRKSDLDVAFIALHGRLGEDGTIQGILQKTGIPYPGAGVEASGIAINKVKTQNLLKSKNIPVAEHVVFQRAAEVDIDQILKVLSFPVVVKPACEGSSIGVGIVNEKKDLEVALKEAFGYGNEVLVERFIPGKELTVGILDEEPLCVIEICHANTFFDFTSKYKSGTTQYLIPAALDEKTTQEIQKLALRAHQAIGCENFSRIDIMLDQQSKPYILEINTIPGFTSTSLLPKAAQAKGISFTQLCLKLIELAYEKKK